MLLTKKLTEKDWNIEFKDEKYFLLNSIDFFYLNNNWYNDSYYLFSKLSENKVFNTKNTDFQELLYRRLIYINDENL